MVGNWPDYTAVGKKSGGCGRQKYRRFSFLILTARSSVGLPRAASDPRGVVDGQKAMASI
jgi:hypothetical protein